MNQIKRSFYTMKLSSGMLKEIGYKLDASFVEARERGLIIAQADSQMLRTIRDIRGIEVDGGEVERLVEARDKLRRRRNTPEVHSEIVRLQKLIFGLLYVPDYVTVVIDHNAHYKRIIKDGVTINGKVYRRISCSAGQARACTVVLCNTEIIDEVRRRIDNGRNMMKPLAPSKYNAYFGLSTSATKLVSEPRFIVVPDYSNVTSFMANYVTETDWSKDDDIDVRLIEDMKMNRTDGMGLITRSMSEKWAEDVGLDYVPSQWCVRQSFVKGMLCTFPIVEFCEEMNGGNYIVDTIYKDADGNPKRADLREVDVILTESQFKLWDSYDSMEQYIENCHTNHLYWGVSQFAPKEAKSILQMNYQFLQTLDLDDDAIARLCNPFEDWVAGVSFDNPDYAKLFLYGINGDTDGVMNYIRSSGNNWVNAVLINPYVMQDKFIRGKIRDMVKTKIHNACMGEIFVDGNFQVLVSDPYGFMQHVCGLPVTGLLKSGEAYSNYWNERGVSEVDSMRSPLTFRSEHVVLNLVRNDETEKWYRYCKLGIIMNYHDHNVVNYAGADFDFDILATTSNREMINGVYRDELPVVYDPPSPKKIMFTEDDLVRSDMFAFGSKIGQITNKSTAAYAMLPDVEDKYGKDSDEYKILESRLKQACKAQSAQIDKTKIGRSVKEIPDVWIKGDPDNAAMNHITINKHPYFFRYRYKDSKNTWNKYVDENNMTSFILFRRPLEETLAVENPTDTEKLFISNFYKYQPLICSDSVMNRICRRMEKTRSSVLCRCKEDMDFDYSIYKDKEHPYTKEQYDRAAREISAFISAKRYAKQMKYATLDDSIYNDDIRASYRVDIDILRDRLYAACGDMITATNCAVDYYYSDKRSAGKDVLWDAVGNIMCENLMRNLEKPITFPVRDDCGDIVYLGRRYSVKECVGCD